MPSRKVFVSYVRENEERVKQLAEDVGVLGHVVWFDRSIPPGAEWWPVILQRIRDTDVVAAVLSPVSIDSFAFEQETKYAALVNRLIVPVLIEPVAGTFVPKHLSKYNFLDYTERTFANALSLSKFLNELPQTPPLPDPLPDDPVAPDSYIPDVQRALNSGIALSRMRQQELFQQLKTAVWNKSDRLLAIELLVKLKERKEVPADRVLEIDELLKRVSMHHTGEIKIPPPPDPTPTDPKVTDPTPPKPSPPETAPLGDKSTSGGQRESRVKHRKTGDPRPPRPAPTRTIVEPPPAPPRSSSTRTRTTTATPPRDVRPAPAPTPEPTTSRRPGWGTPMFTLLVIGAVLLPIVGVISGIVGLAQKGKRGQGLALIVAALVGAFVWWLLAQPADATY